MRLYTHIQKFSKKIFQSTHPSRGATGPVSAGGDKSTDFNPRTPHGVRRPGDQANGDYRHFNPRTPHGVRPVGCWAISVRCPFQSTHPSRGATRATPENFQKIGFQSTHPSRGATVIMQFYIMPKGISIHAPLTGCDWFHCSNIGGYQYFNPRTPHGVRLTQLTHPASAHHFNPRTPHGVRHSFLDSPLWSGKFQSTHPSRGATRPGFSPGLIIRDFNPRTPHGVRHKSPVAAATELRFQSTHPSRGATPGAKYITSA